MARLRPKPAPEPDRAEEAAEQLMWARMCARAGGLLRQPDDPLVGGPSAEDYDRLTAAELRRLAEEHPDNGVSGQVLKHLRLAAEAVRN